jgi:predicted Rossmann fold nucleotide-binding protein DprA/Smf involved in DNA uptake
MDLRPNDHVTLLLTAHLPGGGTAQPLAPGEWSRFSAWLKGQGITPGELLVGDPRHTLAAFQDKSVTLERLLPLLDRSFQVGLLVEKWQRAGLWVITRSSPDYPMLLQERLGDGSPPLFYGAGDRKKLDTKALAVVGSRNAGEEDLHFARQLGHSAAQQGWSIVSGGARGVDEASMRGAIEAQGTVIGVVADSLLKTATSHKYRDAIQRSDIVLLCPYHPESGFSGPNAMSRNKHVYCLSRAAVVVCSDTGKGGTWAGATEDLKKKWVPVWVKHQADARSGNRALLERGALALPDSDPHALRMEELERGSLTAHELFAGQPAVVHEPAMAFEKPGQAGPLKSNGTAPPSNADDMEAVLKALTTPMTYKALAKHLGMTTERIDKLLEHLVHLHKVEPPVGRKKSYKLAEPDLFS